MTIKNKKKIICIDYDGTITTFPDLLIQFIRNANIKYTVIICTMRTEQEKDSGLSIVEPLVDNIYYTNRKAKKKFLNEINIYPDLWIDDNPEWILNDVN